MNISQKGYFHINIFLIKLKRILTLGQVKTLKKLKLLKRARLYKILSDIYNHNLTIVEAPLGFGKTTAVRSFLKDDKILPLWISFLHTNEPASLFWEKFSNEISKLDENSGTRLQTLGFPVDVPQVEKVLTILNGIKFHKKTVLVIDDFHLSQDMTISKLLLQMVAERIENLHFVIITRDTTNINFAELLSKGLCYVVSQQNLKFTESETYDYCQMMMAPINAVDLKKINAYTEGWISLIYMILLGLENGIPVGMSNSIDELVENVFYNVYEEAIREFLLKLSLMDAFTAKQALFVTKEEHTIAYLKKLCKENAFVSYDQSTQIYKIHNVLLDYLRIKENFNVSELQALHHRLGEWYLEKNEFVTAYGYFYKAGEEEKILSHLNNPKHIRNELTTFEGSTEMFSKLPQKLRYQYPLAYLQHILLAIVKGDENTIVDCSNQLDNLKTAYMAMTDIDETYRNRIIAEILIFKRFTSFNTIEPSGERNEEILRRLNGQQSYIMSRENEFTLGSPHLLYVYFRDQGTFFQISQLAAERFVTYTSFANGCGAGCEYLIPAEYALETGNWSDAELNSFKAIYKAQTKAQVSIILCANFTLIRLYLLQGKVTEGIELLKQLELEIALVNNPIYNTSIDMCKGYLYACLGQLDKIPYWLQIGDMTTADLLYQGVAFNYIVYGKAVMLSKNYIALEILTETLHEQFSLFSNQLGMIHNAIFKAVAKYHIYGADEGVKYLEHALSMAKSDGIVLPFVENAPHILDILKLILENTPQNTEPLANTFIATNGTKKETTSEFIQTIVSLSEQYMHVLNQNKPAKIKLTQREKEVLSLVAKGLTRDEIAAQLLLSQGTVKTHMKNIYLKLEVNGKIAAIKIAQHNHLI